MELERCLSSIRTIMGYFDSDFSIYIDVLGPLYVFWAISV